MNLSGAVAASAAAGSRPADAIETALIPRLQEGLTRLNACAAEVFLALGGALQSVATQAHEVAGLSKSATSLGAAGESDESMSKLQLILGDAIQVQALGRVSREKLHEVFGHLKHCQAPLSHLMKLPSVLRTVGMLYRIEASRLEGASVQGVTINVSSLTADMDEMGRQIGERVAAVGSEGARLAQLFQAGTEHMDEVEEQERGEASNLIQQTSAVIASFRARQKAANEAARKIDQQYGDMRLASDRIVMSLQSEDMARQRIEHVQEALAQIASGVEACGLQGADADILMLQRSQLRSTRELLAEAIASVREGLRALGARLDALATESSSWASKTDKDGHLFSAEVKSKLSSLCSIFDSYLISARNVVSTVDSVLPGLQEMTNAVNEVEEIHASIRILALNAGIKTARSGKMGAAIGSLAVELHGIAKQSDADTRELLERLRAMQRPLSEMEKQKVMSLSSNMLQWSGARMTEEMHSLVEPVIAESGKLSEMLATLQEKTAKLRTDLRSASEIAERAGVVIQTFEGVLKQLDRHLKAMGHSPEAKRAAGGGTSRLSTLYSMQSERLVHEQMFEDNKSEAKPGEAPMAAEPGNDVELF
jgi:hypothetical protein